MDEFFKVLGLPPNSSFEDVRDAYKDLVKVWHPDRFANHSRLNAKAEVKLKEINDAYERLLLFFKNPHEADFSDTRPPEAADSQGPTVSTEYIASRSFLERRNARLRLLAFLGAVCLIVGSSLYLAKNRRVTNPASFTTTSVAADPISSQPQASSTTSANSEEEADLVASPEDGEITEEQLKEAREVLLLIDIMDLRLRRAWNNDNDFGVTTVADRNYLKGATAALRDITTRLDRLPDGDYRTSLFAAAIAYKDVGQIRVSASEQNGEANQRQIVKQYGIEGSEPHLWAWGVLELARDRRNQAASALSLPERKYQESLPTTTPTALQSLPTATSTPSGNYPDRGGLQNTITLDIDPTTGRIAVESCPVIRTRTFVIGTEPRKYCGPEYHQGSIVDPPGSRRRLVMPTPP